METATEETADAQSPDTIDIDGQWLVDLVRRNCSSLQGLIPFTSYEQQRFDAIFTLHGGNEAFRRYHIRAIRECLRETARDELPPDYPLTHRLLTKDDGKNLLVDEKDLLHTAFRNFNPGILSQVWPELLSVVKLLVEHGASTTCLDDDGTSLLFYACSLGSEEIFQFLLDRGADLSTRYRPESYKFLHLWNHNQRGRLRYREDTGGHAQFNILEVALNSLRSRWYESQGYYGELQMLLRFGTIVKGLLQKGLTCAKDDPGVVMVFHLACYHGDLDLVDKLIAFGVATRIDRSQIPEEAGKHHWPFDTALHAAAASCQLSVAHRLLDLGENPRECATCYFPDPSEPSIQTPIEVAIRGAEEEGLRATREELLTFVKGIMERSDGLADEDCERMVDYCARNNDLEFTQYLLQTGFKPRRVPVDVASPEMAQILISHGAVLEEARGIQQRALEDRNLAFLRWSVTTYGPHLPSDEKIWSQIVHNLVDQDKFDVDCILYMATEYPGALHIDTLLPTQHDDDNDDNDDNDDKSTSWLYLAISSGEPDIILALLKAGADPSCPGLPLDAAQAIREYMQLIGNSRAWRLGYEWRTWLEVIHLLESHKVEDWSLPSYDDICSHLMAKKISVQRHQWDNRIKRTWCFEYWQESSCTSPINDAAACADEADRIEYEPLLSKTAFRLLRLLPSGNLSEEPLQLELVNKDINQKPDFEALSYVWGPTRPAKYVQLGEQRVAVRSNLHSALVHLRRPKRTRTLWVDALCINQTNEKEREQQVSIMGYIYKSATRVVVWLGEAADDSHAVFDPQMQETSQILEHSRAWDALARRPWFYRTWVIQELLLARSVIVMCGNDEMDWFDLKYGWEFLASHAAGHVEQLSELQAGQSTPFEILQYSRECYTTLEQDRIYGILGLFEQGLITVDYELPVEKIFYSFTKAVIQKTRDLNILRLCTTNEQSEPSSLSLPSWVPDYRNKSNTDSELLPGSWSRHWHGGEQRLYTKDGAVFSVPSRSFSDTALPGLSFLNDDENALVVRGMLVDKICAVGSQLPSGTTHMPGSEAFKQVIKEWETLAMSILCEKIDTDSVSVTAMFAATLSCNKFTWNLRNYIEWYRHCGAGVLAALDPAEELRGTEYVSWWLSKGSELDQEDSKSMEAEESNLLLERLGTFAGRMEKYCYGRRYFITDGASMGLACPGAREGDHIALIPGSRCPFVLRKREGGWTLVGGDCYLYGLNPWDELKAQGGLVQDFVIL